MRGARSRTRPTEAPAPFRSVLSISSGVTGIMPSSAAGARVLAGSGPVECTVRRRLGGNASRSDTSPGYAMTALLRELWLAKRRPAARSPRYPADLRSLSASASF